MKYLVAIPIPEPYCSTLLDLKRLHRPQGWKDTIDPHITLLAPDQPLLPIDEAATAFAKILLSSPRISIRASRIGSFQRKHTRTLVLIAEPALQLRRLFRALVDL